MTGMSNYVPASQKRPCSKCGKPNAVKPARLCPTCKRVNKKASRTASHERHVADTYGLLPGEYAKLLTAQNGSCAICGRGGKVAHLAVDHDHALEGRDSVRGLLCKNCNFYLLGRMAGDSEERLIMILTNAIAYLHEPPAQKVLNSD